MHDRNKEVLAAFSVDHAARVTGLSKARLTRWDRLGFFSPEYIGDDNRRNPYARMYSYSDLVGLRTLKILADKYRVPLNELRKAAVELEKHSDRPWAEIPLGVLKKQVVFDLDKKPRSASDGQYTIKHVSLERIDQDVRNKTKILKERYKTQIGQFERRKHFLHNAEVISGTRIPVFAIQSFIDAGYSNENIIKEYPTLSWQDIEAVRIQRKSAA